MKLALLCLLAFICLSQVYSQVPRPNANTQAQLINNAAVQAETQAERAIASRKPVVARAPSFGIRDANGRFIRRPVRPTITPQEEAAVNRQIKYDRKAEQRVEEPTNQANSRQRQIAEAAKELKGKTKPQVAAQIVDIQKSMNVRQDRITQLQNVIKAREPAALIPNNGNDNSGALAAGRVKMNSLEKMNAAESLKGEMGSKWTQLVSEQAADVQKLKALAKFTEENSASNGLYYSNGVWSAEPRSGFYLAQANKEIFNSYVVNYARKIQERENGRMQALVNNNEVQKAHLDDKMRALQTVTNNPNSPLGNEANFDDAQEFDSAEETAEFDSAETALPIEEEPINPREAFHQRRHGKVSVDVKVEA